MVEKWSQVAGQDRTKVEAKVEVKVKGEEERV